MKDIYESYIFTYNILSCKRLKAFPIRSGTRQKRPLSQFLFNIVLEVLARKIRLEKLINKGKASSLKLSETISIHRWHNLTQKRTWRIPPPQNTMKANEQVQQSCRYRIHIQNSVTFLYICREKSKRKLIPFTMGEKRILRNRCNQESIPVPWKLWTLLREI